jgi:alkyl sulfatase BDS1-like metallo-beta-lactamase superfamily hydrolase
MVETYKNKFNKKYNLDKDTSHSLNDISKLTGYKLSGLKTIYNKGIGAYKTNPQSVRPQVKSPEQWAMARVYSAVMGGKAAIIDAAHLKFKAERS